MDKLLLQNLNNRNYSRAEDKDFENTKVFRVEGDESNILYWNSSNSESIHHNQVLKEITNSVLDDEYDGRVYNNMNEIMFEEEII